MSKSRQKIIKFEYLKDEKSFLDEIKKHILWCLRHAGKSGTQNLGPLKRSWDLGLQYMGPRIRNSQGETREEGPQNNEVRSGTQDL